MRLNTTVRLFTPRTGAGSSLRLTLGAGTETSGRSTTCLQSQPAVADGWQLVTPDQRTLRFNAARQSTQLVLLPIVTRFLKSFPDVNVEIIINASHSSDSAPWDCP